MKMISGIPAPSRFEKTAILMMADSVEAASKSLVNPSYPVIEEFVEKIVAGQMEKETSS